MRSILPFLLLRLKDHLCQRSPQDPGAKEGEDPAVGVHHDRQVPLRLQQREGHEAVRKEEEVVQLAAHVAGVSEGLVSGQERLEPGASVEHWEELLFEVYYQELAEEGDVVAAVVAVPHGQEDEDTCD